ncbi:Crp/Fnr family transcriptional regulator [Niabella drilacis]|uniref:cAMP-binding domain of CRP or a regulatory subunit of cAMP-dependent protein kinases n=1 Tax=Niabella drilacis (strain DSM 25811 / CCM 8410 / CCUG 62505 / LMG 26954 / E90) TaxID=1285928 RepID=A0A1G6KNP7_NIADE|nr:Crp/Fnr family transcriptional regulator [Niabella drilacis]SDC32594.1 cAMP-binding domain of CRP or a regulatory subunit of cAMP-dependent protein kinases [Niabella drilacis]
MSDLLINRLNAVHPLSDELTVHLRDNLVTRELLKKDYLLKRGQVCEYIYFVERGLLRCFYEKNDEQITSWFMKEEDVIIAVNSFFNQSPSEENIVALEHTLLHGIHFEQLQEIYSRFIEFNIVGRILTTRYYILSEERLYFMRRERARDRYLYLLGTQPDLLQRVPLKYIASYLGINLETLSRIRSDIKNS